MTWPLRSAESATASASSKGSSAAQSSTVRTLVVAQPSRSARPSAPMAREASTGSSGLTDTWICGHWAAHFTFHPQCAAADSSRRWPLTATATARASSCDGKA